MQLELEGGLREKSFKIQPTARLDRKHEVAVIDVIYAHRDDVELKSYDESVNKDLFGADIAIQVNVQKEGLNSSFRRDTFKRVKYSSDYRKKTYVREFDIWNYEMRDENRLNIATSFNPISDGFRKERRLTLRRMVELINAAFEGKREMIEGAISETYGDTSGAEFATKEEYFKLPKLILNEREGTTQLYIPYYVRVFKMANWLRDLLGFEDSIPFERFPIKIPNPTVGVEGINPSKDAFYMLDPCISIQGLLKTSEYKVGRDANAFIFSDLIDHRLIGGKTAPLLRMFPLKNKLGINWIQFANPHYFEVRYDEIANFNVSVLNELGNSIEFEGKIFATLHFREKEL